MSDETDLPKRSRQYSAGTWTESLIPVRKEYSCKLKREYSFQSLCTRRGRTRSLVWTRRSTGIMWECIHVQWECSAMLVSVRLTWSQLKGLVLMRKQKSASLNFCSLGARLLILRARFCTLWISRSSLLQKMWEKRIRSERTSKTTSRVNLSRSSRSVLTSRKRRVKKFRGRFRTWRRRSTSGRIPMCKSSLSSSTRLSCFDTISRWPGLMQTVRISPSRASPT